LLLRRKAARKDSAVHVSLSSDSPVKQPGTMVVPSSAGPRVVEATNFRPKSEVVQPLKVRSFGGAPSRRHADGTPYSGYIRFDPCGCQHVMVKNLTPRTCSMKRPTSGPALTYTSLSCECWNQKTTDKYRASSGALDLTFASRGRGWVANAKSAPRAPRAAMAMPH
jgi:hypothetical protein